MSHMPVGYSHALHKYCISPRLLTLLHTSYEVSRQRFCFKLHVGCTARCSSSEVHICPRAANGCEWRFSLWVPHVLHDLFMFVRPVITCTVWSLLRGQIHTAAVLRRLDRECSQTADLLCLQVIHQCVAFGLFVTPVYFMWEKAIGELSMHLCCVDCRKIQCRLLQPSQECKGDEENAES